MSTSQRPLLLAQEFNKLADEYAQAFMRAFDMTSVGLTPCANQTQATNCTTGNVEDPRFWEALFSGSNATNSTGGPPGQDDKDKEKEKDKPQGWVC